MSDDIEGVADWASKDTQARFLLENPEFKAQKAEIALLNRKLLKVTAGTNIIVNAVKESYQSPPGLKVPKSPSVSRRKDEEIAVLHISDTQIGKRTSTYNTQIALNRLMLLAEKTVEITNNRRNGAAINEIRVYLGGDMVEGEDIFAGQPFEIDQPVFDQACHSAPTAFANVILLLLENFPKVKVCAVSGNHGRNGRKGTNASTKTNWDSVCYQILYWMLQGSDAAKKAGFEKRLTFDIAEEAFFTVDRVYDWGNLMVHGHQIAGGGAGFPINGTQKKAWGWIDAIPVPWDYLYFGHFHTYASFVLNGRVALCNGTTESDNVFAQELLAAGGFPCQRLAFYSRAHGLISDNQVYLDSSRVPQKAKMSTWGD